MTIIPNHIKEPVSVSASKSNATWIRRESRRPQDGHLTVFENGKPASVFRVSGHPDRRGQKLGCDCSTKAGQTFDLAGINQVLE